MMDRGSEVYSYAPTNAGTSETRHNLLGFEDSRCDQNYQKPKDDVSDKTKMKGGRCLRVIFIPEEVFACAKTKKPTKEVE